MKAQRASSSGKIESPYFSISPTKYNCEAGHDTQNKHMKTLKDGKKADCHLGLWDPGMTRWWVVWVFRLFACLLYARLTAKEAGRSEMPMGTMTRGPAEVWVL